MLKIKIKEIRLMSKDTSNKSKQGLYFLSDLHLRINMIILLVNKKLIYRLKIKMKLQIKRKNKNCHI